MQGTFEQASLAAVISLMTVVVVGGGAVCLDQGSFPFGTALFAILCLSPLDLYSFNGFLKVFTLSAYLLHPTLPSAIISHRICCIFYVATAETKKDALMLVAISQYAALMLLSIQYNCTGHYSLWCMYPSRDVAVTDRYTAYICNKTDLFSFGHHTCSKLPCVLFLLRQQSLEWVEDVESRGRLIHSMVF